MTTVTVKDDGGREIPCISNDGYLTPLFPWLTDENRKCLFEALPEMKFRDDDVMLCSFPKTGTNWLFEVMSMILRRSAVRVDSNKVQTFIESQMQEVMEKIPSPRIMNTHMNYRFLPKDMCAKQTKTVLILRNPKDTAVSYFNHMRGIKMYNYAEGEWKDWLRPYVNGEYEYGKYTDYLKDWEQAITTGVGFPLHVMYFEDLKLNGKEEIDKLSKFLDVELDDQLKLDIMEACKFEKMSKEREVMAVTPEFDPNSMLNKGFKFFRKGQIGDWTNWFTVQQNEDFDKIWTKDMEGSTQFSFTYTANK